MYIHGSRKGGAMNLDNMFTVTECAEFCFVSPQAVRKAIKQGRIKAKKLGYHWVISRREVKKYLSKELR